MEVRLRPQGNPAQQQPFSLPANRPLVVVPEGTTGWFLNAIAAINAVDAKLHLLIDESATVTSPAQLAYLGNRRATFGVLTVSVTQGSVTDYPQYGPIYNMEFEVSAGALPFRKNVSVYLTETEEAIVIGAVVNLAIITDAKAFSKSLRALLAGELVE